MTLFHHELVKWPCQNSAIFSWIGRGRVRIASSHHVTASTYWYQPRSGSWTASDPGTVGLPFRATSRTSSTAASIESAVSLR
ncbi:MAG: hypothetical protein R2713_08915 [Ilumatobacteraceae bacterium]